MLLYTELKYDISGLKTANSTVFDFVSTIFIKDEKLKAAKNYLQWLYWNISSLSQENIKSIENNLSILGNKFTELNPFIDEIRSFYYPAYVLICEEERLREQAETNDIQTIFDEFIRKVDHQLHLMKELINAQSEQDEELKSIKFCEINSLLRRFQQRDRSAY